MTGLQHLEDAVAAVDLVPSEEGAALLEEPCVPRSGRLLSTGLHLAG